MRLTSLMIFANLLWQKLKVSITHFACSFIKCNKLSLIVIVLLLNIFTHAQNTSLNFNRITVNDGLSQSWIQCIIQDKLGYMWFGSEDGLNRFDGYEIVQYKNNYHDKNSICNNTIRCINEDADGNLWIGTQKGLNLYDRGKNIFYRYSGHPR